MLDEVTTKTVAFTKIRINNKNQYTLHYNAKIAFYLTKFGIENYTCK